MSDKVRAAARAVISYVNRYSADFDSDFIKLVDAITVALAEPASADRSSEWIPVAERLPEPSATVLVYCKWGHAQARYVEWTAEWISTDEDIVPNVTHWRPLPEPPA